MRDPIRATWSATCLGVRRCFIAGFRSSWVGHAVASITASAIIAARLIGAAAALGWMSPLDAKTTHAEIGLGILVVAITAPATGASVQALSPVRVGPAVLIGPVLALAALAALGGMFEAERDTAKVIFGSLPVLAVALKLGHIGVHVIDVDEGQRA